MLAAFTVSELGQYIILLGGVVASCGVMLKAIANGLDRRIKDHIDDVIEPLRRELKPNSGKSLRDDVTAIKATVEQAEEEARYVGEELKGAEEEQGRRHQENAARLGRLERSHASIRNGVLWLFEAHRRSMADEGKRPPEQLAKATEELRMVEAEYRFEQGNPHRPPDPVQ